MSMPEVFYVNTLRRDRTTWTVTIFRAWAPRTVAVARFRPADVSVKEHKDSLGPMPFWGPCDHPVRVVGAPAGPPARRARMRLR